MESVKSVDQITPVKRGQEGFTGQAQIGADREAESSKLKAKKVSRKGAKAQRKKPKAEPG